MTCHGGFHLDDAIRRTWYNPDYILSKAGLAEGMVFADIGSGDGFFSLLAAEKVGMSGKVYAVDTDAEAISRLKLAAAERGLNNIHAVVGEAEKQVFCRRCIDLVFFSMVLHDFHDPLKVLKNAKTMLNDFGKAVDLDWKKMQAPFGPPEHVRFSEEKAQELMGQAGFRSAKTEDVGPYHYVVMALP